MKEKKMKINKCKTFLLNSRLHFGKLKNVPVLQLDASVDFHNDLDIQEQVIEKVL